MFNKIFLLGGGRVEQQSWSHTWNSSQTGSGPVVTHSWNKTSYTGADGVTRETSHSSTSHGGDLGSKYKVVYTSSGGNDIEEAGKDYS